MKNVPQAAVKTADIAIEGPVSAAYLKPLDMNEGLRNFRNPLRQKEALQIVAGSTNGMVYIVRHKQEITGYVLFHPPNRHSRWNRHPRLLELGAIEISPAWKRRGLATALLQRAFTNDLLEQYVVITTEYFWHWDLKSSGLDVWDYQKMLTRLFGRVGFKRRRTDDPEILEHPANMLMVRFGRDLSKSYIRAFDELTYQQSLIE